MLPHLGRLTIYTRRIPEMTAFYGKFFGYRATPCPDPRMVELVAPGPGIALRLHPAAKGQKMGQSLVKLVFDVEDVEDFCRETKTKGLTFGAIHRGEGYCFANAKDPSGNSICVSSAAFAAGGQMDEYFLDDRKQPMPQSRKTW